MDKAVAELARRPQSRSESFSRPTVDILSIATANPGYKLRQEDALAGARAIFPQFARLESLFSNTGIDYRYNCQPVEWYQQPHSWEERTAVFQEHALDLLEKIAVDATAQAGLVPQGH